MKSVKLLATAARWRAWSAVTLACLAGLASQALALSVEHARTREQFGAPLAALPAVRAQLADAALAVDGLTLLAWATANDDAGLRAAELLWAGAACSRVTASAHQVHGAVGFALETGPHRLYRRARAMQTWTAAACAAASERPNPSIEGLYPEGGVVASGVVVSLTWGGGLP